MTLPLELPEDLTEEQIAMLLELEELIEGFKHGDHDQEDHGNWAETGGVSDTSYAGPQPDRRDVVPDPTGYPSPHGAVSGVVFHGGGESGVDLTGRYLVWTTNRQEDAAFYDQNQGQVTALHIEMQNPANEIDLAAAVVATDTKPEAIAANSPYTAEDQNPNDYIYAPAVREELERQGFDGIRAWDTMSNYEIQIFVPFHADVALQERGMSTAEEIYQTTYDTPVPRKSLKHGDHDQSDHGNWATGEVAAGETAEGKVNAERLFGSAGVGLDASIGLKTANVKANGAYLIAAAKDDPELHAQLTAMGSHVEDVMDKDFQRDYLHLELGMNWEEIGAAFVANALQQTWAETASDNSSVSLALQQAVADRFGIDTSEMGLFSGIDNAQTDPYFTRQAADTWGVEREAGERIPMGELVDRLADSPAVKTYVEGVYEQTQQLLKDQGIKEMTLYRGMGGVPEEGMGTAVTLNPLSSFSIDDVTARDFAVSHEGAVLAVTVPAERVFSVPMTGPGCLNEAEVIVIGGEIRADAYDVRDYE